MPVVYGNLGYSHSQHPTWRPSFTLHHAADASLHSQEVHAATRSALRAPMLGNGDFESRLKITQNDLEKVVYAYPFTVTSDNQVSRRRRCFWLNFTTTFTPGINMTYFSHCALGAFTPVQCFHVVKLYPIAVHSPKIHINVRCERCCRGTKGTMATSNKN